MMMSVGQRHAMVPVAHTSPDGSRVRGKPSRLEALQVDFQNKMLKEKEERLLKHLDGEKLRQQKTLDRYQGADYSRQDSSFSAPGGVRTFFSERKKQNGQTNSAGPTTTYQTRKKEGYDKSRPLEPINHNALNSSPSRLPVRGMSDPSMVSSSKAAKKPTDFEKWRMDQDMLDRQRRANAAANRNHVGDYSSGYSSKADRYQSDQLELQRRKEEEELERRAVEDQLQQEALERRAAAARKQEEVRGQRSVIKQKQDEKRRLQEEKGRRRREEAERRQKEMAAELQRQKEVEQAKLDEQAEMIKQLEQQLKEKQQDLQNIQKRKPRELDLSPEPYQQTGRSETTYRPKKQQQYKLEDDSHIPSTKPKKVTRRDVKVRQAESTGSAESSPRPTKTNYSPSKSSTKTKSHHELNATYQISREDSIPIVLRSTEELEPFVVDGEGLDLDLSPCAVCGRNFATDRLAKHQKACKKISKPRKQFNTTAQRIAGSGAEKYQHRSKQTSQTNKQPPRKDWRAKREEFVASLRYARKAAAIEAQGGNIADLPPPPKSENLDYVQCPHCNRRFNEAAGERHIPKCQSIKAKPSMLKKGSRR